MLWDSITELLPGFTIYTVILGLIGLAARHAIVESIKNQIKSEYDKDLETHKANLKSKYDAEVETLKSTLAIGSIERQITFSKLHETRAEVIAECYSLLRIVLREARTYTAVFESAGMPSREVRYKAAAQAYDAYFLYYETRALYFPRSTQEKLSEVSVAIKNCIIEFSIIIDRPGAHDPVKWNEISEKIGSRLEIGLRKLEDDLKILLGDKPEDLTS